MKTGSLLLGVMLLVCGVAADRVLVVFPMLGKSHSILGEGYVNTLLQHGHEVTYITPFEMKNKSKNLTQVVLDLDMSSFMSMEEVMNVSALLQENAMMRNTYAISFMAVELASIVLNNAKLQAFLVDPKQRFDLVVAEWFFSELYAGFGPLFDCPLVWASSLDAHAMLMRLVDEVPNPAYTPDIYSDNRPPFTFLQRATELWVTLKKILLNEFILMPKSAEIYERVFHRAAAERGRTMPPYREAIHSAAMTMLNGHPSLGDAPRLPQNVKEVGGYHITPPAPLPEELEKLMDAATKGVVYFSLGSNMKSKDMPVLMQRQLLKLFAELPQTVLWKYEADLKDVPSNVHVRPWFPQQSILNHRNTKLFITHGGMLSTTETVHFGVPAVVVPLFADQFLNAQAAVRRGFARQVHFTHRLAAELEVAIAEVLGNPEYTRRVRELSTLYHDRPLSPASELIYWLEYTARHRSLAHLASPALSVAWYQRLYLDLIALLVSSALAAAIVLRSLVRAVKGGRKNKVD